MYVCLHDGIRVCKCGCCVSDKPKHTLIAAGQHMSVAFYQDTVWTTRASDDDDDETVEARAYVYKNKWKLAKKLPLDFSSANDAWVTLSAADEKLTFVSTQSADVIVHGLAGERLKSVWSRFNTPLTHARICDDDYRGNILVMTDVNRCLVMVDSLGQLLRADVHSTVGSVQTTLFFSDYAYVVSGGGDKRQLRKFHTH